MRLQEKVAVITGAGSGIGREAALLFAAEGAKVVAADLNGDAVEAVASEIRASGGEALDLHVNVAKSDSVEEMIGLAEETFGRVDVLYNNAGIFPAADGSVLDIPESVWDQVMSVNL